MKNFKQTMTLTAVAAVLAFAAQGAMAAEDNSASGRTVGAGSDATATVNTGEITPATGADATVTTHTSTTAPEAGTETTTKAKTKKMSHKKHYGKKHVAESKVLNATPGDHKTSNDDSGMNNDDAAHAKAAVTTTDPSSDNQ